MSDINGVIEGLFETSYRLELLGESLAVEAREIRRATQSTQDRVNQSTDQGVEFEDTAKVEAALQKLQAGVEQEIRYQVDTIRDVARTI